MSIDGVEQRLLAAVGSSSTEELGVLNRRDFLRYALAAADDDYVATTEHVPLDERAAAPVMFLPGILHWTAGPHERELRADGLAARDAPGVTDEDVNVMHGGQRIEFHQRAIEGMRVVARRELRTVDRKQGRGGDFLVVVNHTRFLDEAETLLATVDDTILVLGR